MNTGDKKGKKVIKTKNFLEALRELGNSAVQSGSGGVNEMAKTAFDQLIGSQDANRVEPNQQLDLVRMQKQQALKEGQKELEKESRQFYQDYLDLNRQEKLVYTQKEQETKMEIAAILEELKKLSVSTKNLAKEVEVASKQIPSEPGVYHLNFYERLRQTLIFLRKKIDESATWLSAFNGRAKKRNYYWRQVKKSGTKFMLSQERYMSTQAG